MNNQSSNIEYSSSEILDFYTRHRQRWDEVYPSEQWVFNKIAQNYQGSFGDILDVGCAAGGLANALNEQFKFRSYTGVDIHKGVIQWAKENHPLKPITNFVADDIVSLDLKKQFDMVVSLGCADWNVQTLKIIQACWQNVKPSGYLVISLRLTPEKGINDIKSSYQMVNFSGKEANPEKANYVVLNFSEAIKLLGSLSPQPSLIGAYGYWGAPSSMAVTLYKKIVFGVFYIQKGNKQSQTKYEFNLPKELTIEDK